jgi:hypothetical protein
MVHARVETAAHVRTAYACDPVWRHGDTLPRVPHIVANCVGILLEQDAGDDLSRGRSDQDDPAIAGGIPAEDFRREHVRWVAVAKRTETRERRTNLLVKRLLEGLNA